MSEIIRGRFAGSLDDIRARVSALGLLVESMVVEAMQALQNRDEMTAESVIPRDDEADALDLSIEESCIHLLWSQQPVAADLRVIGTAMKAITDLERIGDHAVDIARLSLELTRLLPPPPVVDMPRLADAALTVLRDALHAFADQDMAQVRKAVAGDEEVDRLYWQARADLDTATESYPQHAIAFHRLGIVALYLERVADHAVNIAERVAFMLTGDFRTLAKSHGASQES